MTQIINFGWDWSQKLWLAKVFLKNINYKLKIKFASQINVIFFSILINNLRVCKVLQKLRILHGSEFKLQKADIILVIYNY